MWIMYLYVYIYIHMKNIDSRPLNDWDWDVYP